jgi:hypothetical protein
MAFTMACPNFKKGLKMAFGPLGLAQECYDVFPADLNVMACQIKWGWIPNQCTDLLLIWNLGFGSHACSPHMIYELNLESPSL